MKPESLAALAAGLLLCGAPAALAQDARVIELTQIPCQFVESENGVDHGFTSRKKADCEAINAKTGAARLGKAKAGRHHAYVFKLKVI